MKKIKSPFLKSKLKNDLPKQERKGSYQYELLIRADKAIEELKKKAKIEED
ncbi:hypothetical protein P4679_24485 [Priestia megaterium]|uniref:hypothetical protein n=1 Tax=Priestia megaterium TaxID=1404 RepID=UPI002E21D86E|nr:hypothetical protein [Priestia megaterium]